MKLYTYTTDNYTIIFETYYDNIKNYEAISNIKIKTHTGAVHSFIVTNVIYNHNNSIILDVKYNGISLCIKLGHMNISENVINYVNSHSDDYVKVFYSIKYIHFDQPLNIYYRNITYFDMLVMEKTDTTLYDVMKLANIDQSFNLDTINYLTYKLMKISIDLINNGYYYFDLKPANIGVIYDDDNNKTYFKLIDIDSISLNHSVATSYTDGKFKLHMNKSTIQFVNAFLTVIVVLFNNKYYDICDDTLSINEFDKLYDYIEQENIDSMLLSCGNYKYVILTCINLILDDLINADSIEQYITYIIDYQDIIFEHIIHLLNIKNYNQEYVNTFLRLCLIMYVIIIVNNKNDNIDIIDYEYMQDHKLFLYNDDFDFDENKLENNISFGKAMVNYMHTFNMSNCTENCENVFNIMKNIFTM